MKSISSISTSTLRLLLLVRRSLYDFPISCTTKSMKNTTNDAKYCAEFSSFRVLLSGKSSRSPSAEMPFIEKHLRTNEESSCWMRENIVSSRFCMINVRNKAITIATAWMTWVLLEFPSEDWKGKRKEFWSVKPKSLLDILHSAKPIRTKISIQSQDIRCFSKSKNWKHVFRA